MPSPLQAARRRAGISQEQLAELANVPQRTISDFERSVPRAVVIAKRICRALDLTLDAAFPTPPEVKP